MARLRYAAALCAAATMLGGCGGSQPLIGNPEAMSPGSVTATQAGRPARSRFTGIYSFDGGNGAGPDFGVISDRAGAIYGTTTHGGTDDHGTVFKLTPSGSGYTESFLYSFKGGALDGQHPSGRLTFDGNGALYGTTSFGGKYDYGAVFKLAPSGSGYTESVLYSFCANSKCPDGAFPSGSLVFGKDGALYGTTALGGAGLPGCENSVIGCGTIFKLVQSGSGNTETVLYSFCTTNCADGAAPNGGLIFGKDGALYGTTFSSCIAQNHDCGTVFKLKRSGSQYTETTLYNFAKGGYGNGLVAGVIFDKEGAIWGTAYYGGGEYTGNLGSVFKLTRSGSGYTQSFVYKFKGGSDGSNPFGGLTLGNHGMLYGTTQGGGHGNSDYGTVFTLTPSGSSYRHRVIHRFTMSEGTNPEGSLILDKHGLLYGTATSRGSGGWGTVFKLEP
jgi:uncharacterized repeat protein (TIGR03803 family)